MELVAYSTSHHFITRIFYRKFRGKSYFSRKANDNDALFVNYNLGVVMSRVEWSREAGVGGGGGGAGGGEECSKAGEYGRVLFYAVMVQ